MWNSKKGITARFEKPGHFQAQMDYVFKWTTFTDPILNTRYERRPGAEEWAAAWDAPDQHNAKSQNNF